MYEAVTYNKKWHIMMYITLVYTSSESHSDSICPRQYFITHSDTLREGEEGVMNH